MKTKLLTLTLCMCLLLSACGSTSTQDTQDVQNPIEEVQEPIEVVEEPIEDIQEPIAIEEYIPFEVRNAKLYKAYFNRIGYVYGSLEDSLDDDLVFEAFEEYSTSPQTEGSETILLNYTNANGVKGSIRFDNKDERKDWTFDSIDIYDSNIMYLPNGLEQRFEQFVFGVYGFSDISSDGGMIKECVNEDALKAQTSWLPLMGNSYRFTPNEDMEHTLDVGDNYAKIIYRTDYEVVFSQDGGTNHIYPCTSYTCIYDDYENEKRYIILYGVQSGDETKVLEFMNSIEFVEEENLYVEKTTYWMFPEGMEGYTQKSPYQNGMSRNITSYTTPNNHEMLFHWYGPSDLGSQAIASNGVLTLQESEGLYKLNAQAIPTNEIVDRNDIGAYGLMEHEHYVEGDFGLQVDDYGTQILYPIIDDNGYKGYATLLYGSDYAMPQDYLYFFTYVEREDVYDDERALDVMASLDYHLGITPNSNVTTTTTTTNTNAIMVSRNGEDASFEIDENDISFVKNIIEWGAWSNDETPDVSYDCIISYNGTSYSYHSESGILYDSSTKQCQSLSAAEKEMFNARLGRYITLGNE